MIKPAEDAVFLLKNLTPLTAGMLFAALLLIVGLAWWLQVGSRGSRMKTFCAFARLAAFGLVVLILAEPVLRFREAIPQQSVLAHLYDTSGSMRIADCESSSRFNAVKNASGPGSNARMALDYLYRNLDLTFDEGLRPLNAAEFFNASEKPTDLLSVLRGLQANISGLPMTGVVLYSDGIPTVNADPQAIIEAARQLQVPVYAVGGAPVEPQPDFWVESILAPEEAPIGVATKITALVGCRNVVGKSAKALLYEGDRLCGETTIQPQAAHQSMRTEFMLRPAQEGMTHYKVQVVPGGAEVYPWNNEKDFFIRVVKNQRKILYVEGYPRHEYRFLRASFEDDERFHVISLVYVNRERTTYRQGVESGEDLARGFPSTAAELAQYDVVVIGDVSASEFSAEQVTAIRDFVANEGGGLLFLAGDSSFASGGFEKTLLADALPFTDFSEKLTTHSQIVPTQAGSERSIFGPVQSGAELPWNLLPALRDVFVLQPLKPGAVALCAIEQGKGEHNPPAVAYQRYGKGVVLACGISATWPWRFQTPSNNGSYQAFWKEMTLILTMGLQKKKVFVEARPSVVPLGSEIAIRGGAFDDQMGIDRSAQIRLEAHDPQGKVEPLPLAALDEAGCSFKSAFKPSVAGMHRIVASQINGSENDKAEALFLANAESPELKEVRLNETLLREMASMTGGEYVHYKQSGELSQLIKPREGSLYRQIEKPLWDRPHMLIALLGLLLVEWLLRRLSGMA